MSLLKRYTKSIESSVQEYSPEKVVEAINAMDMVNVNVDRLELTYHNLAASIESLESVNNIDLNTQSMINHMIHAVNKQTGMDSIISFESMSNEEAHKVSLEGVKETAKKIWDALVAFVQKAIKVLGDFFSKIFGGVKRLVKAFEAQQKTITELSKSNATVPADAVIKVPVGM